MIKKIIFFLLLSFGLKAHDSLRCSKFKIFDIVFHGSAPVTVSEYFPDFITVSSFTKNQTFLDESIGYTGRNKYNQVGYFGGEGGLLATFKLTKPKTKFLGHLHPRIGLHYSTRTFFDYSMEFSRSFTIDTIKFTNPKVTPILIDSSMNGTLNYTYYTNQLSIQLGCNIDVLTFRRFNLYAGLMYSPGFSFKNEFSVKKYEYYLIDKYPDQSKDTKVVIKDYTLHESGNQSFLSILAVPIGVQHRFSVKRNFSLGFLVELRPGYEIYKIQNGNTTSKIIFSFTGGLRLSLQRHK